MNNEKQKMWIDSDGRRFSEEHLHNWIKTSCEDKFSDSQLIVGTDSHLHGREFRFVTVVCVYKPGKGGNFYYTLNYENRQQYKGNQKARMFYEVTLSLGIADELLERTNVVPVIHIDASPKDAGEFTSAFSDQLRGYVVGSGYECVLKPDSFVANAVADKFTK